MEGLRLDGVHELNIVVNGPFAWQISIGTISGRPPIQKMSVTHTGTESTNTHILNCPESKDLGRHFSLIQISSKKHFYWLSVFLHISKIN